MTTYIPSIEVLMPIKVPDSVYCWEGHNPCEHFDNEGGHARCLLNIGDIKHDGEGRYVKPFLCHSFKASENKA